MGYSVPSKDRAEWHSILRGTLYPIGHERSLSNRLRTWSHLRRISFLCADCNCCILIFLVLTLKSRCYFVYDIFAIVRMPLRCNVLECFTARFIAVGV